MKESTCVRAALHYGCPSVPSRTRHNFHLQFLQLYVRPRRHPALQPRSHLHSRTWSTRSPDTPNNVKTPHAPTKFFMASTSRRPPRVFQQNDPRADVKKVHFVRDKKNGGSRCSAPRAPKHIRWLRHCEILFFIFKNPPAPLSSKIQYLLPSIACSCFSFVELQWLKNGTAASLRMRRQGQPIEFSSPTTTRKLIIRGQKDQTEISTDTKTRTTQTFWQIIGRPTNLHCQRRMPQYHHHQYLLLQRDRGFAKPVFTFCKNHDNSGWRGRALPAAPRNLSLLLQKARQFGLRVTRRWPLVETCLYFCKNENFRIFWSRSTKENTECILQVALLSWNPLFSPPITTFTVAGSTKHISP